MSTIYRVEMKRDEIPPADRSAIRLTIMSCMFIRTIRAVVSSSRQGYKTAYFSHTQLLLADMRQRSRFAGIIS
jgi:hypothetical protein